MLPPGGGVELGDVSGDRVDAGAGVPLQGADGGVAGAGQQHRGGGAAFGVVGEGAVAEAVQGPAVQVLDVVGRSERVGQQPGVLFEDLLSAAVGQPRAAGLRAYVQCRRSGRGLAAGEEQRAAGAAGDQASRDS